MLGILQRVNPTPCGRAGLNPPSSLGGQDGQVRRSQRVRRLDSKETWNLAHHARPLPDRTNAGRSGGLPASGSSRRAQRVIRTPADARTQALRPNDGRRDAPGFVLPRHPEAVCVGVRRHEAASVGIRRHPRAFDARPLEGRGSRTRLGLRSESGVDAPLLRSRRAARKGRMKADEGR